LLRSTA